MLSLKSRRGPQGTDQMGNASARTARAVHKSRVSRLAPAAFLLLATAPGLAQEPAESSDAEAKALFAAGREAFDAGKYGAALARWQEAWELSKRPALLYNIGLAHDRLRHDLEAVQAFEDFLKALPDDARAP